MYKINIKNNFAKKGPKIISLLRNTRFINLFPVLILILGSIFVYLKTNSGINFDDAYISFRYAKNIAHGLGFVYNAGEKVYGTTTFLWTILLSLISKITFSEPEVVEEVINFILLPANVLLVYYLIKKITNSLTISFMGGFLFLSSPLLLLIAVNGMETMLYIFLMLYVLVLFEKKKYVYSGILSGLVFTTRPDGLIVLASLISAMFFLIRREVNLSIRTIIRVVIKISTGFLVITIPFLIFNFLYFHQLLPNTLRAKRFHTFTAERWWMLKYFLSIQNGLPVIIMCILGFIILIIAIKKNRVDINNFTKKIIIFFIALVWLLFYAAAWTIVRIDLYPWYIAAMAPFEAILIIFPLAVIKWIKTSSKIKILILIPISAFILTTIFLWTKENAFQIKKTRIYYRQIEIPRKEIALAIKQYIDPKREIIGMGAIGIVGYYSDINTVIDYAGLVTPKNKLKNYPPPTIYNLGEVDMNDTELNKNYKIVYMHSADLDNGPDSLILVRKPPQTSWDPTKIKPEKSLDCYIKEEAKIKGVTEIKKKYYYSRGEIFQFQILWHFLNPINSTVDYYLNSSNTGRAVAVLKTTGMFRNRRKYSDVSPNETIYDFVNFKLPENLSNGRYFLSVGDANKQCKLLTLEISK